MSRLARPALGLLLLALPALGAGGWTSWKAAYPTDACGDGWLGCRVGTSAVGPGFSRDAAGRPIRSDLRLGWFDLAPTAALSPFQGLSRYEGAPAGAAPQVAEVVPPAVAVNPNAAVDPNPAGFPANGLPTNATAGQVTTHTPPTVAVTTGTTLPPDRIAPTTPAGQPVGLTTAPPQVVSTPTAVVTTPPSTPTSTTGTTRDPMAATQTARTDVGVSTPPTNAVIKVADAGCDDVVSMEPLALMGQLSADQRSCLDGKVSSDLPQTTRDKLSRVLIANADAKGDKKEWERLVRRHLEDIDRSDPDLCYKYALQLSRGDVNRASGVIRWADYALENKQRWSGQTYKSRVNALLKIRSEAAAKLWQAAEATFASSEHTDENEAKATKLRGAAKDYAREWLDYARTSGQDTSAALALCISAAGNRAFCEGG